MMTRKIRTWVSNMLKKPTPGHVKLILYEGLSLREMIHEFKYQTLVLFKGLLLQPKVCANPSVEL